MQHLVLNGIRWQVHPEFAAALPRLLTIPPELVKTTPSKVVHRHRLEDRCFYVKRSYHNATTWQSLSAVLFQPRNRVDWQLASRLGPRQVEVVPHVAYGERWSWRGLNETALVTLAPEGYVTLHEVPDLWRPQIQYALGSFLAHVHDAGVALRDLHTKNLLFSISSNTFCLVDLDTVTIRSHVNLATRIDHLARLHYRLPLSAAFYDAYSQSCHIDPDKVARLAPLHRRSRCLKRNSSFDHVRQGGLNWWVRRSALNPELLSILAAPDVFLEREGRLLKREDHAIVGSGHGVVVKRVHNRGALGRVKNLFRQSPARRAYRKAYHLELAGIPSAKPVAMSARRFLGLPASSYFIMDMIPGATHLHTWRGDWRQTIKNVAELIGQLHRAGFVHRDLKETNIVFDLSGRPSLLDLDGLEFIDTVPDQRAASDLARLLRGAARSFTLKQSDLARFLAHYCEVRGGLMWRDWWHMLARNKAVTRALPPTLRETSTQALPGESLNLPKPLRRHVNRTSTQSQDLRQVPVDSPPDEAWVPLPGLGNAFVRRDWQSRFAAAGLTRAENFFHAQGEPLSKPGLNRRYRARLTFPDKAQIHVAYLKRYHGESLRNLCRRWFEDGHRAPVAEREVRVPRLLAHTGITTVQPIAWGWTGPWGCWQQSFVVTAAVPGISLERWLSETVRQPTRLDWVARSAVVNELARLVRLFHRANWRHRDLYLCHVFIQQRASSIALTLLDLARVFQPRFRSARWLIKDLAQLHYSAPHHVSRATRLRFIHHYLECKKLTPAQRQFVRHIQLKRNQIARHDSRKHRTRSGETTKL